MTFNTLHELVSHSVANFSERIAFAMIGGEEVSYKEVGKRIETLQELLLNAGVGAGDRVVILSSSMPNWGVSYFAITTAGMVAVPILPDFTSDELDLIIAHSEAKAILVSDKLYTKLSKKTLERMNIVIRTKGLNVISQRVKERAEKSIPQPEDLAAIIYTSGTTSKPKGVMLSHYNTTLRLQPGGCAALDSSIGTHLRVHTRYDIPILARCADTLHGPPTYRVGTYACVG